jgi:hypothetical protein
MTAKHRVAATWIVVLGMAAAIHAQSWGRFQGRVQTQWNDDGRTMQLLADFVYIDPAGHRWLAPKGARIDGASIPPFLWTPVGGPFEGKYRLASVVHDVACDEKKRPWRDVHRMFYTASLLAGVDQGQAKLMFAAVYHFGPRWGERDLPELSSQEDFERMREFIRRNPHITPAEVEALTEEQLEEAVPVLPADSRPPVR